MQHDWVNVERGLYKDRNTGTYFERIRHNGKNTWQSLYTEKLTEARDRLDARRVARAAGRLGLKVKNPDKKQVTVVDVIRRYQADGYPSKNSVARGPLLKDLKETANRDEILKAFTEKHPGESTKWLSTEMDNCMKLTEFFDDGRLADAVSPKVLDSYHKWRVDNVSKGAGRTGHRTTDLELNTLNSAYRWATRQEMITANPIATRNRYHSSRNARHCNSMAPNDADELHSVAALLFSWCSSEVLGWQMLFEALTGLRTAEALRMRMDARPDEPGGLTQDGGSLCVRRSKNPAIHNPYVAVHDGLKEVLGAHKTWHDLRYPNSPWYFPGRDREVPQPVYKDALTKALERLLRQKKLKRKLTSHGLRAFYVLVRRSQGATDAQIAWEINHTGGVGTLERVYGGVPPHWLQAGGPNLSWIPKRARAWDSIKEPKKKSAMPGAVSQQGG